MADELHTLERDIQRDMENLEKGSKETPITLDSSDSESKGEGEGDDSDSDLEVLETRKNELIYEENMDEDQVEELLIESEPQNLQERTGFGTFTCPVCMEQPEKTMVTPCGHMYCTDCGLRALSSTPKATDKKGECSICRRRIDYKQIVYLEIKLG